MKNSISSTIGILTLLSVGVEGAHAARSVQPLENVRTGVYYDLTPQMANALSINLAKLQDEMSLKDNEKIVFKIQEDGELDLSIYENQLFFSLRADGVVR